MSHPTGVALGPDGSLYIVDTSNDRVRRVGPDGIITTVAGGAPDVIGVPGCSGDGGPATEASLGGPRGVALGPDGSLYIAGLLGNCIRRVGPDGIITAIAGPGVLGFSGDGGPATEARLNRPFGVALSPNGSLYFADTENGRIRRVGPDGIITTVAGIGILGFSGDGGPATEARLNVRPGVALGPDGSLYIADRENNRIRRVGPPLPGFAADDIAIASEDGAEFYRFDASGRHLATRDAVTGATLYSFTYDAASRLAEVKDVDGDITRIERDASGAPTDIVAPDGQRTRLTLDANGYLAGVTNPAGERHAMAYTDGGLMSTFTTPRGPTNRFTYDARGLLVRDLNAGGGEWTVNRVEHERDDGYDVTMTSGEGRTSTFTVEPLTTGDRRQRNTAPDGTVETRLFKTNGETTTTAPDGTVTTVLEGPDPRFGMQSPLPSRASIKLPSGLTLATTLSSTAALANPSDLLSLTSLTNTTALNGRAFTQRFTGPT